MRGRVGRFIACSAVIAAALALVDSEGAAATTFCVPGFTSACPGSGGNVAEADVEKAMFLQGEDGIPDQVRIAAGTFTENGTFEPPSGNAPTFEPYGDDPLTIVGAGPGATVLTSSGSENVYLFNFSSSNSRPATMRDLTVRVPASFPDGLGSALQLDGDILENVDVVSLNEGSDGIASIVGSGNVFRNGEMRGEGGGSIDDAVRVDSGTGSLLVEDSTIVSPSWGLQTSETFGGQLIARRVNIIGARTYGVIVSEGSLTIENSVMTIDDGIGIRVSATADDSSLTADHVTILNTGSSSPAIQMAKASGAGKATTTVSNSILRGFSSGYEVTAAAGPGIGIATLTARYSDFPANGTSSGVLDIATGDIDVDPLLNADLSLPQGSPSIDAGDPAPGGLTADFLGALRPVDGNGDGVARRDQGAFEYQPPIPPAVNPLLADTIPPQTTISKGSGGNLAKGRATFRFRSSEAGARFECKLDRRKVAGCKSPKRYRHLKPGPHLFKAWAIDAAGNKDPTPAKRRFRVPPR